MFSSLFPPFLPFLQSGGHETRWPDPSSLGPPQLDTNAKWEKNGKKNCFARAAGVHVSASAHCESRQGDNGRGWVGGALEAVRHWPLPRWRPRSPLRLRTQGMLAAHMYVASTPVGALYECGPGLSDILEYSGGFCTRGGLFSRIT